MFVPTYIMTVRYLDGEGELQKEIISLPYVPNPSHFVKLHNKEYRVLETTADVDGRSITLKLEAR